MYVEMKKATAKSGTRRTCSPSHSSMNSYMVHGVRGNKLTKKVPVILTFFLFSKISVYI